MLSREDWRTQNTELTDRDMERREARLERTELAGGEEEVGEISWEKTEISRTDLDLRSTRQKPRVVPTRQVWRVLVMSSVTIILADSRLGRSASLLSPALRSVSSSRTVRISQPQNIIFPSIYY